jgi:hypothetical protein
LVISCGTGLGLLLRNGIKPDVHCELENVEAPADLIEMYRGRYDLSGILLFASTTVDHRLAGLFDRAVLFFRPGLASERLFGAGPDQTLANVTPLVSNLGLCAARVLGASSIYLVGIDLGTKDLARHHSQDSPYMTGMWQFTCPLPIKAPGNFGGEVFTEPEYLMSRHTKELEIAHNGGGRRYFNCSDGVAISGAQALAPADIALPEPARAKSDIIASFVAAMAVSAAAGWHPGEGGDLVAVECDRLAGLLPAEPGYEAARDALVALASGLEVNSGAGRLIKGSVTMMGMEAWYRLARADQSRRDDMARLVIDLLRARIEAMDGQVRTYFAELASAG